jgi:hypothetical protein
LAGAIIFVAGLVLGGGWARGLQVGQPLTIEVIDARPLAEAIRVLEERHGWIVTYEDARYEHESDIEDVTLTVRYSKLGSHWRSLSEIFWNCFELCLMLLIVLWEIPLAKSCSVPVLY